ncbi:MAG: 4Fe-4S binding protein [Candidatus Polarisedimenticolia bacterium]|nr:4Fe-4S binding protein [bacterium]
MRATREMIEIDEALCDGCGACVPSCREGALVIEDGKARVVAERLCDGLGACVGRCPKGALRVVRREAEPFVDPHALDAPAASSAAPAPPAARVSASAPPAARVSVSAPPAARVSASAPPAARLSVSAPMAARGCPGAGVRMLRPLAAVAAAACPSDPAASASTSAGSASAGASALSHWPVQIRLVPPTAPFLDGATLLVAADCVPVACRAFHDELLPGRAVMIGCPKFDDLDDYVERFARLFAAARPAAVEVAVMQVPCCQSLPLAVARGMELAGANLPLVKIVVGLDGTVLSRERI